MGEIEKEKILDIFDEFPWTDLLSKIKGAKESSVHFSPSLEFENKSTQHGLCISILDEKEYYIFYRRPKRVTKLFGLIKKMDGKFTSERTGQTIHDARKALTALIDNDITMLEEKWG